MGRGGEPGLGQCFTISGWLKIFESCAVFTCLMLHRIGDQGQQVWFGASDQILNSKDNVYETEVDAEILGGCVMAFCIITPMILLAYALEGTDEVQKTSLDTLFSFTAAATLIAAGGMTCFAWNNASETNSNLTRRTFEAAGALGILCIGTGVLYLIDFFWVVYKKAYLDEPVENYRYN